MSHDDYPSDHDPLLPAIMEAASRAENAGDLAAHLVLDAVLEFYTAGRIGELAKLIETHRPVVTPADRAMTEAARDFAVPEDGEDCPW